MLYMHTRTADFGTLMSWKSFSLTSTDAWMLPLDLETLNKEYKLITQGVLVAVSVRWCKV